MSVSVGPRLARLFVDESCALCLEALGTRNLVVGSCGHVFHDLCLKGLVLHSGPHVSCPMCKEKDVFLDAFPPEDWDTPWGRRLQDLEREAGTPIVRATEEDLQELGGLSELARAMHLRGRSYGLHVIDAPVGDAGLNELVKWCIDSLVELSLVRASVGPDGERRLADVLDGNTSLKALWLDLNPLGSSHLLSCSFSLTSLSLGGTGLSAESLATLKDLRTLEELALNDNDLGNQGAAALAAAAGRWGFTPSGPQWGQGACASCARALAARS
jgi:hypothetical protein